MTPEQIRAMFTGAGGDFVFARWGRPIAPVVFGVLDETLAVVKGAFEAVTTLAGHSMVEIDPDMGSNCMLFFIRDWRELADVPDLEQLVTDVVTLVGRLNAAGARQYRLFRFDDAGAIEAAFVFLRMDQDLVDQPADEVALGQVVQIMLAWSDAAFKTCSPLAVVEGTAVLRPEIADLIRAAYDPVLPGATRDGSHALRLFARMPLGN